MLFACSSSVAHGFDQTARCRQELIKDCIAFVLSACGFEYAFHPPTGGFGSEMLIPRNNVVENFFGYDSFVIIVGQ